MRIGKWIRLSDGTAVHIDYTAPRKRKLVTGPKIPQTNLPPISWPATRKDLYAAGYTRAMHIPARACKRCKTLIEFWHTPNNSLMPLEINPENKKELLCHFNTCPHAEEFRKPEQKARPIQRELF